MTMGYFEEEYEKMLKRDSELDGDSNFLVFVHPNKENSTYTKEDEEKLTNRPFASRLYIVTGKAGRKNVFLRTRHTDNAKSKSQFWQVRDYVKCGLADDAAEDIGAGVAVMSEILRFCMRPGQSDNYYTWACVLASALSHKAKNTLFEHEQKKEVLEQKREQFIALMDIIFTKIELHKFLCNDGSADANIYRVAYYNKKIYTRILAIFSFSLQLTLLAFVLLEVFDRFDLLLGEGLDGWEKPWLTLIAVFNIIYESISLRKGIEATKTASDVLYATGKDSTMLSPRSILFKYLDWISNICFPLILGLVGSFIIATEDSYVGGLLNLAVFSFISQIDDEILGYVDIDVPDTIEDFLMFLAREQYQERVTHFRLPKKIPKAFSDIHVTGIPEMPSGPGYNFAIYEFNAREAEFNKAQEKKNPFVTVSNLVTKDCVFTKISGRFTESSRHTSNPFVNELILCTLDGKLEPIKYVCIKEEERGEMDFEFEGYFCITSFAVGKTGIHKLRMCGVGNDGNKKEAFSGSDFLRAFEYYSLWDIDDEATKLLKGLTPSPKLPNALTEVTD